MQEIDRWNGFFLKTKLLAYQPVKILAYQTVKILVYQPVKLLACHCLDTS
jgi:hypothetical protein